MLMQACALDVLPSALPRSVHLLVKVFRVFTSCSIGINIRFEKLNYDTVAYYLPRSNYCLPLFRL